MNDITETTIQDIIKKIQKESNLDNKSIFLVKKYIRKMKTILLNTNKKTVCESIQDIVDKKKIELILNLIVVYNKEINRNINDMFYACFEYIYHFLWRMKQCEQKEKYMKTFIDNRGTDMLKEVIIKHYENVNEKNKDYLLIIYQNVIDIDIEINKKIEYSHHLETIHFLFEKCTNTNQKQFSKLLSICNLIIENNIPNIESNTKYINQILSFLLNIISNDNKEKSNDNIIKTLELIISIITKISSTRKKIKQSPIISTMHRIYIYNKEKNQSNQNILLLLKDLVNLIITQDDIFIIISFIKTKTINHLQLPKVQYDVLSEISQVIESKDNLLFTSLKQKILDLFSFFTNDHNIVNLFQKSNALKSLLLYLQSVQTDNDNYNNTTLLNFTLSLISSYKLVGNVSMISDNLMYSMSLICIQILQDNINIFNEKTIMNIIEFLKWKYNNTKQAFEQTLKNDNKGNSIETLFLNLIRKYGEKDFLFNFFSQIPNGVIFKLGHVENTQRNNVAENKLESTLLAIEEVFQSPNNFNETQKIKFVSNIQSLLLQIQLKNKTSQDNVIKAFSLAHCIGRFTQVLTKLLQFLFQVKVDEDVKTQELSLVKIGMTLVFNTVINNPFSSLDTSEEPNDFSQYIMILISKISLIQNLNVELLELFLENCVKIVATKNDELINLIFSEDSMKGFIFVHLKRKDNYSHSIIKNIVYLLYILLTMNLPESDITTFIQEKYLFDFIDLVIYCGNNDAIINKHTQTILSLFYSLYKNALINNFCSNQNLSLLYDFISKIKILVSNNQINNCIFFEMATIIERCIESIQNVSSPFLFIQFYQCGYIDFIIDEINKLSINYIYENSLTVMTCNNYKNNNIDTIFSILAILMKFDFKVNFRTINRFIYEKVFNAINIIFPEQNLCKDINYLNITLFNSIIYFLSYIMNKDSIASIFCIKSFRELLKKIKVYLLYPPKTSSFTNVVLKILSLFTSIILLLGENELMEDRDIISIGFFRSVVLNIPREERKIKESFINIISNIEKTFMKTSHITQENVALHTKLTNPLKPIEIKISKNPEISKDVEYILKEFNAYLLTIKQFKKENNSEIERCNENIFMLLKSLREICKDKENADTIFKDDMIDLLSDFLECDPFYCLQYVKNEIILLLKSLLINNQRYTLLKKNKKINHYLISQFNRLKNGNVIETNLKSSEYLCNKYEFITSALCQFIEEQEYLKENNKLFTSKNLIHIIDISNPNDKIISNLIAMLTKITFYENNIEYIIQNKEHFSNKILYSIYMNFKNNTSVMQEFICFILCLSKETIIFEQLIKINVGTILNTLFEREKQLQLCCLILDAIIALSSYEGFINQFYREIPNSIDNIVKKVNESTTSQTTIERCLSIFNIITENKIYIDVNKIIECSFTIAKKYSITSENNIKISALKIVYSLIELSNNLTQIITFINNASIESIFTDLSNGLNGDSVFYLLSICTSIYEQLYKSLEAKNGKVEKNCIEMIESKDNLFQNQIIPKVIEKFSSNEKVIIELFKLTVSLYKTSKFLPYVGLTNENYIDLLLASKPSFSVFNEKSYTTVNICLVKSLIECLKNDEISFISQIISILDYLLSFLSNCKNVSQEKSSVSIELLFELSKKLTVCSSNVIDSIQDIFTALIIKNNTSQNKKNISKLIEILGVFFGNKNVFLPNLFLIMILEIITLKKGNEDKEEELIDTSHKVTNETIEDNDNYSVNLQNLLKISEKFCIETEIDAKKIAALLTELFQNSVNMIKQSLIPLDSDYQNLSLIFILIRKLCDNSTEVLQIELKNPPNNLSEKINTFLGDFGKNRYLEENKNEVQPQNEGQESIEQIYTELSVKSNNNNTVYNLILNKEEAPPKDFINETKNIKDFAQSCLLSLNNPPKKKQAIKEHVDNNMDMLCPIILEEKDKTFLMTPQSVKFYNEQGEKKNALIYMDASLQELFVKKNKNKSQKIYDSIQLRDMDSCLKEGKAGVFKKAGGFFGKKPNPNNCFVINRKKGVNTEQKSVYIECETENICIKYVNYISGMIMNELHKKGK